MGDQDPTDPQHPEYRGDKAVGLDSGESVPPEEHTARVRAARTKESMDDDDEGPAPRDPVRKQGPASVHVMHDEHPGPSSTEMAQPSRKRRRRERDSRAERRAIQITVLLFLGLGGLGYWFVNHVFVEPPPAPIESLQWGDEPPLTPEELAKQRGKISSPLTVSVDLPALRQLEREGITVGAEGLPEVTTEQRGEHVSFLAVVETCRFAYGVWEFSPNKRFRFLPTCKALKGQVMVGAYEVDGGVIRMSPLVYPPATLVSEFHVEKPSRMLTHVVISHAGNTVEFQVQQRINAIRPGLEGEGFRDSYKIKNTIDVPGVTGGPEPLQEVPSSQKGRAPAKHPPKKDPLLDLLRQTQIQQ